MKKILCADCCYYDAQYVGSKQLKGKCRRHAPRLHGRDPYDAYDLFPFVNLDDWCGEAAPKEVNED
jgi:hypothetical protein